MYSEDLSDYYEALRVKKVSFRIATVFALLLSVCLPVTRHECDNCTDNT